MDKNKQKMEGTGTGTVLLERQIGYLGTVPTYLPTSLNYLQVQKHLNMISLSIRM